MKTDMISAIKDAQKMIDEEDDEQESEDEQKLLNYQSNLEK